MRKIYRIIGGMLIAGCLLAGMGSGVTFAEYSSFEYGGEAFLEGSERFTKTLSYRMPEQVKSTEESAEKTSVKKSAQVTTEVTEEKRVLNIILDYNYVTVEDSSVPKDTVRFVIHYLSDSQNVNPVIRKEEVTNQADSQEKFDYIYVDCDFEINDFRDMVRAKDPILSDLKNHKIREYRMDGIENVEICVNPQADFEINVGFCN